jgi:hypothetical protein
LLVSVRNNDAKKEEVVGFQMYCSQCTTMGEQTGDDAVSILTFVIISGCVCGELVRKTVDRSMLKSSMVRV